MTFLKVYLIPCLMFATLLLSSCNSDDEPVPQAISEEEAVEIIAGALAADNGGLSLEIQQAAENSVDLSQAGRSSKNAKNGACGVLTPVNLSLKKPNGVITFDYSMALSLTLACVNDVPNSVALSFNTSGQYDGPRLASNGSSSAIFTVGGINPQTGSFLTFEGEYSRNNTNTFKLLNLTTNSILKVDMNVNVSPTNYLFVSGSGEISLSGTTNTGGSYNYKASLSFLENNLAELSINGLVYQLNLSTGNFTL